MGISVYGELSSNEYFCISQIKKSAMEKHGLNMTIKELRERARNSKPFGWVLTGSIYVIGYHKKTSIYRYAADLMDLECKHDYCEEHRKWRLSVVLNNIKEGKYIQ